MAAVAELLQAAVDTPSIWTTAVPAWIQAVASLGAIVTVLVLVGQLKLLKNQLELTKNQVESGVHWNRLNAAFTFFQSETVMARERAAAEALEKLGVNLYNARDPLAPHVVNAISSDLAILGDVRAFLSLVEDYCTAVNQNAIDPEAAYAMMSGLIIRWGAVFAPFIEYRRAEVQDDLAFCELESLASSWATRDGERRMASA